MCKMSSYSLYASENAENYGWYLTMIKVKYFSIVNFTEFSIKLQTVSYVYNNTRYIQSIYSSLWGYICKPLAIMVKIFILSNTNCVEP